MQLGPTSPTSCAQPFQEATFALADADEEEDDDDIDDDDIDDDDDSDDDDDVSDDIRDEDFIVEAPAEGVPWDVDPPENLVNPMNAVPSDSEADPDEYDPHEYGFALAPGDPDLDLGLYTSHMCMVGTCSRRP